MEEEWRAEDSGEESESSSDDSSDGEDEDWNDEMSSPPKKRQSSGKGRGKQSAQSSGVGRGRGRGRGRGGGRGGKTATPSSITTTKSTSKITTPSLQLFKCPTCSKEFSQAAEFEAHLREKYLKLQERHRELTKETEDLHHQLEEMNESDESHLKEQLEKAKTLDQELNSQLSSVEKALRDRQVAALMNITEEEIKEKLLKAMRIPAEDVSPTNTVIGRGTFSDVYVGLWRRIPVAVKSFKKGTVPLGKDAMQDAFLAWGGARHPNIAAINGFISSDNASPKIVMEILEGSLLEVMNSIRETGETLAFREQIELANGVVSGVHYLHSRTKNMIIHGNLWPANILITPFWNPKITDLGLSKYIKPSLESIPYQAPELRGENPSVPTKASDRFSIGIILCEVFSGCKPPEDATTVDFKQLTPEEIRKLCVNMTKKKTSERTHTSDALAVVKPLRQKKAYKDCAMPRRVTGRVRRENEEFFSSI